MTWARFWKSGEQFFDRLYTIGLTFVFLIAFKMVPLSWWTVFGLYMAAFIGGVLTAFLGQMCGEVD